ncbi:MULTISPECIES: hypothetical protein [Pseudomonas]|uniref:hypothetical protein n=1 Tax=Pseudomonas TaxID=286 RepID=UPI001F44B733|nr:hypothetical protein [Pseudomonas sputi]
MIEDFDKYPESTIAEGESLTLDGMKLTHLSGKGPMGIASLEKIPGDFPPIPGRREGKLLTFCIGKNLGPQRARLDFINATYSTVSFYHSWVIDKGDVEVHYYNSKGDPLGSVTLEVSVGDAVLVEFSGKDIAGIEFNMPRHEWWGLDFLKAQ